MKHKEKKHLQRNMGTSTIQRAVTAEQVTSRKAGIQKQSIQRRAFYKSSLHHWKTCTHNPGHEKFIPVKSFSLKHLSGVFKTEEVFNYIQLLVALTVRLVVRCRSNNRPKDPFYASGGRIWTGTGTVVSIKKRPKSYSIKSNTLRNRYTITIRTACHVVFDSIEASNCIVEFFYDSEIDEQKVKRVLGTSMCSQNVEEDSCYFECTTTDKYLARLLDSTLKSLSLSIPPTGDMMAVIVSHPHGLSKHISIGQWNHPPSYEDYFFYTTFNKDSIHFSLFPFKSNLVNKATAGSNPPFSEPVGIECDIHFPDGERSKCHIWQIDRLVKHTKEALISEGGIHIPADQLCLELDLGNGVSQVMKDEDPLEYYWDDLTVTCTIIMRRIQQ